MITNYFVRPAIGVRVRCPETGRDLPPGEGCAVPVTSYWTRRIRSGDVNQIAVPDETTEDTEKQS